jgi:coenzyme F420 hydrogenase subunit beta
MGGVKVPSAFVLRPQMNGISEAPGKVWFWELAAAVIDAQRCVQCGACVAACPTDSIGVGKDDLPQLVKMCTGCSLCWDFCPRGGLRYESTWLRDKAPGAPGAAGSCDVAVRTEPEATDNSAPAAQAGADDWRITGADPAPGLGVVLKRFAARVRRPSDLEAVGAQDGGVVSAILLANLAAGAIDGAVVARHDPNNPWKGIPTLATTPGQIRASAGSFYNQTMALASLDLATAGLDADARVAVVGTPCEIQGIRALQARQWRRGSSRVDSVVLTIALLCTKSFDYRKLLLNQLRDDRGVDLAQLARLDVIHGRLVAQDRAGETIVDEPIKDFHGSALKGCDECADFLGRAADISVGSVGSDAGYSSVLIRTASGLSAYELAAFGLEVGEIGQPEALERLDRLDKKTARSALQRELDPDGPLFIDFAEHVTFYGGTERAPVWK